jgi:hypothetical protein
MTISRVSNAIAATTTLSMPSHQTGDLIIGFGYSNSNTLIPDVSGWLSPRRFGNRLLVHYKIAASNSESFGTWTNASHVATIVYRDTTNYLILGSTGTSGSADNTIGWSSYSDGLSFREQPPNSDRWLFAAVGYNSTNSSAISPPNAMTRIDTLAGLAGRLTTHATSGLFFGGWSSSNITGTNISPWASIVGEIFDTRISKTVSPPPTSININSRGGYIN